MALSSGQPIRANYSSTCGGITADVWEAWPDQPLPYLISHTDRDEADSLAADFCARSPHFRWREEWTARHLPFEESFLDLDSQQTEGYRLLFTTRDGREASRALTLLDALEVPVRLVPPEDRRAPGGRVIRLLAPEDRFWEAHQALRPLVGLDEN